MTGRVAVLTAAQHFELQQSEPPAPANGQVLVRVQECGICGSDLKMWAGTHAFMRPPIVMGHEVIGVVAATGNGSGPAPGTAVTLFPPVGCGRCFHCRADREQLCEAMEFFGGQRLGGLADYVLAPATHVFEVPERIPPHLRVLIEPLSVAVHGVERGAPQPGEQCAVIGAGAIGLFTALVLRARGFEDVVVAEPLAARRAVAEQAGLRVFDPTGMDAVAQIGARTRPEGADVVFECVGSEATIATALAATRKGGRAVVVGNAPAALTVDGLALQRGDRTLVGVLMYDRSDFHTAMALLADGVLDGLDDTALVARYQLESVGDAFAAAKAGRLDALKAVIAL
ncbi:MAG TPA: alcohol dehydrogenase catalytic domain-containing protein [Gaiellaceae bacterium]